MSPTRAYSTAGSGRDDVFARADAWMADVAGSLDESPHAIVVWNGQEGDGPGGTKGMVRQLLLA